MLKALRIARKQGRTALDIDYRPNLWGVAGHGEGESRFVASDKVTRSCSRACTFRPDRRHGRGVPHRRRLHRHRAALRAVRAVSQATLVCKRGARGGRLPRPSRKPRDGETGPGFPIEVFNVLGAGDGFMSGLFKGWLTAGLADRLKYANACGAFAVSRHGCTPAYPAGRSCSSSSSAASFARTCATTPSSSRSTGRPTETRRLVGNAGLRLRPPRATRADARATAERIGAFKRLCLQAALKMQGAGLATASSATAGSGRPL